MVICSLRKKTARLACAAGIGALCVAVLLGCNGVMLPKKVNVIADPTFTVGLGKAEEKLDDYASAADIQDMIGGDTDGMTVYDYNPNNSSNDLQQFAVFYDMGTFDIDVNEALDAANVKSANVEIPEQTIAIPTIEIDHTYDLGSVTAGNDVQLPGDMKLPVNFNFGGPETSSEGVTVAEVRASGRIVIAIEGVTGDVSFGNVQLAIGTDRITAQKDDDGKWSFPLSDTPLVSENGGYGLSGSITIPLGSTISGNVDVTVKGEINTIDSALVGLPKDITDQFSQSEDVDLSDLDGLVKEVKFSRIGAAGSFTSTLPEGNDITITVSTAPVGLLDTDDVIKGGAGNKAQDINLVEAGTLDAVKLIDKDGKKILPFTVEIGLPTDEDDKTLYRFTNVKQGATYTLSGSLMSVMEWEAITLAEDAFSNLVEGEENPLKGETDPINLSELESTINDMIKEIAPESTALTEQIEFSGIEAYPFIIKPHEDVFTDVAAGGTITLSGNGEPIELLAADEEIQLLGSKFELPKEPGGTITEDLSAADVSAELNHDALTEMLNKYPADLKVKYDLSITGKGGGNVTITKAEIDKLDGGKLSIGASLIIVVPLELKLPNGAAEVTLSLSSLTGGGESSDGDLLGRTSPDSLDETLDQVIRSLDKLTLGVLYDNQLGAELTARLINEPEQVKMPDGTTRDWGSLTADEQKTYKLDEAFTIGDEKGKADIVNIVGADILDKVLYAWPFNPEVTITIKGEKENGETYIKIPREAMFKASVSLQAGVSINGVYDFSTGEFVL